MFEVLRMFGCSSLWKGGCLCVGWEILHDVLIGRGVSILKV
jgi:hypothetical protein